MQRLLPEPESDIDPFAAYVEDRVDHLRIGLVISADGSATDEHQWTDGLGGAADLTVFRALRARADAIIVGATTVRTGRVGPHRLRPDLRAQRSALGKDRPAPIVVVSRSLQLDWSHRLFTEAASPTIVLTCADADRTAIPPQTLTQVIVVGQHRVDLRHALNLLRDDLGLHALLCEGGPTLAGELIASGLAHEICLTYAPTLVGQRGHSSLLGDLDRRIDLTLTALHEETGVLFARYHLAAATDLHPSGG